MKIEKLPSGNYRIRVIIGHDSSGNPIRKSFTHPDKTRLQRIAFEYADTHRHTAHRYTVYEAIDAFMIAKNAVLSPSTMRAYTSLSKTLKREHRSFCGLYVDDIDAPRLQRLINDLIRKGNTPKTVRNFHGFLSAVFKYAGERLPVVNLPQKKKPVIHIPDEQDIKMLTDVAKGTRMEIPLALAIFGLRRSEICALTLDDLNGNVIHVNKAIVYGDDKQPHVKAPKTYTSDRYIQIPSDIADLIREQGFVTDYTPHGLSHAFERLCDRCGLHCRLHDLRHFFVSYCHNILHLSDAQIQAITGHKTSVIMRENYLHAMHTDTTGKAVSDAISTLF